MRNEKQKKRPAILIVCLFFLIITGCASCMSEEDDGRAPLVGGDRDEHGCIGSAGYTWCEEKQKCLRVWEEECE